MAALNTVDLLKGIPSELRKMSINSDSAFAKALQNPFSEKSFGVRVPDTYSFPTATHHCRSVTNFVSTSTGRAGAYFMPNPVLTMVDSLPFYSSDASIVSVGSTGMNAFPGASYATRVYAATSLASLAAIYSSYRVVSAGVKITNLLTPLNATGRIFFAQVPVADTVPAYNNIAAYGADANLSLDTLGMTRQLLSGSAFINLPTAVEMAATELIGAEVVVCNQIINPSFYDFKSTAAFGSLASYAVGDELVVGSLATVGSVGYKDATRSRGGCAIMVWGEGMPASIPCFTVEHIIHLEGTPTIANTTGLIVPSSLPTSVNGSTAIVEQAIVKLAKHAFHVYTGVDLGRAFGNC